MKISKKFIKENPNKTLKEVFPELFDVELKVGEWYNDINSKLLYYPLEIKNKNNIKAYGFDVIGNYSNDNDFSWGTPSEFRISTPEEVQQALEKEAVNRGFKKGVYCLFGSLKDERKISSSEFYFADNKLAIGNDIIFDNGTWTEIIPSMTKQEAEEKLKCKIVD